MGPVQSVIIDTLNVAFVGAYIDVTNESHMHSVPAGSESHFKVVLVSDSFAGKRLVQRHQLCLLYTSPSPRDRQKSRMPSSA